MDDIETERPTGAWKPPPLDLVVCEPLEDEARRSVSRKSDAELVGVYAIAVRAHAVATARDDRQGEADYWHVLEHAIVEEVAGRPSFGQDDPGAAEGTRRQRRQRRKRLEPLIAAREALLAGRAQKP